MSGELIISGGDQVAVATDEMLESAYQLRVAAETSQEIVGVIELIDTRITARQLETWGAPFGAGMAEEDIGCARAELESFARLATSVSIIVRHAANMYGLAEVYVESLSRELAADVASVMGFFFPKHFALWGVAAAVVPTLVGISLVTFLRGRNPSDLVLGEHVSGAINRLVSDPVFVNLVRFGVMNMDEFGAGLAGVPPGLVSALSSMGLLGLTTSAGAIQRMGNAGGVLKETPIVLASKTEPVPTEAAQSYEERLNRIPQPTPEEPWQVRVEVISTPGEEDRFAVYIAGTVDFGVADTGEPWDSTSNITLAAEQQAAAALAVEAAMKDAGVTSESEVSLFGHSQGATIAARLAESNKYNVVSLVAAGGNTGQVDIPDTVDAVVIEHNDDIVPAIGGFQDNNDSLYVRRNVFEGRELPEGIPVPAHQLVEYRETAQQLDEVASNELGAVTERINPAERAVTTTTATNYYYKRAEE